MKSHGSGRWKAFCLPVALIAGLEAFVRTTTVQSDALAAPSAIIAAGWRVLADGSLLAATAQTLSTTASGLALGTAIGLAFGLMFGLIPVVFYLLEFSAECIRPIPSVALIPVAMLVFGFGFWMESTLVAKAALWPVLIFTQAAVRGVDVRLIDVSRVMGLGLGQRIWKIILPAIAPGVFVGLRLAVSVALIVAVTVEIAVNPLGIGYMMMIAQQSMDPALMYACLVWIGAIGWAVNAGMLALQYRLMRHRGAAGTPA